MRVVGIIPARMGSSRFPGKPLAAIRGMSMIEHVYRRSLLSRCLDEVFVATCDEEIRRAVEEFGGRVLMTSHRHTRCTDRVAEAAGEVEADIVANIQGDEPLLNPEMVDQVVEPLLADRQVLCTTIIVEISRKSEETDRNVVKAVRSLDGNVLYFSRERIPTRQMGGTAPLFKQVGILAFTRHFLLKFDSLPETPLEQVESVDLMRALEHGYPVRGVLSNLESMGVDTPEDLARAEDLMKLDPFFESYQARR